MRPGLPRCPNQDPHRHTDSLSDLHSDSYPDRDCNIDASPTFTPTPVPAVGTPVSNGRWQVTVLPGASNRNTLWQGFYYLYTKKGYAFVDMAVRIVDVSPGQNNTISTLQIKLVDQAGHSFLPFRLGFVPASGTGAIDPSTITLHLAAGDPIADHDVYIRIVTIVTSDSLKYPLKFEYEEIPAIPFSVE